MRWKFLILIKLVAVYGHAQTVWKKVNHDFGELPASVNVFSLSPSFKDSPFIAYYVSIDTKDASLELNTDTTLFRRMTPARFYDRLLRPYVVVNCSFFEFKNNTNVNVIMRDGRPLAYNIHHLPGKGSDTLMYTHVLGAAIGADRSRKMNIGYTYSDSDRNEVLIQEELLIPYKDSLASMDLSQNRFSQLKKWKADWAVGGGPVLISEGMIRITNNEERKFPGKALLDRHPRTAMGYTRDGKLIVLAVQGRMKNAIGATLGELAELLYELGCYEAINLDGGGSSCLLINGKETIRPSDPIGQRPVPAVFYVR